MGRLTQWTRRGVLTAGGVTALTLLSPALALGQGKRKLQWRNWGGNQHSQPSAIAAPSSEQEVVDLLHKSSGAIRPVGSGHSWSGLVPSNDTLLTLDRLSGLVSHDDQTRQAEVWGGTKLFVYGPLVEEIDQGIINMSDIDYQTMAGAVSTSTHGTGAKLGCLSSFVVGLHLVTPQGELIECSNEKNADLFRAACTGLGALGIITRLRFQNREAHRLHQQTWIANLDETLEEVDALNRNNQQFELFPLPNSNRTLVVTTNPAQPEAADHIANEPDALEDMKKLFNLTSKVPGIGELLYNTGLDMAVDGVEHRIGASYRVLAHPRATRFMEMEYTVPAERGVECLREVMETIEQKAPHIAFPLEYRYAKGDSTMIGMFSEQDGCSISVHQFADDPNWQEYLASIEPVFWKYGGRPHWGKWHSLNHTRLAKLYPHWQQFLTIRNELDPQGRMLNAHLRSIFGQA